MLLCLETMLLNYVIMFIYLLNNYIIYYIALPPKIDPSVTMMQVEDKPDVTYEDVGGVKEELKKLREVILK